MKKITYKLSNLFTLKKYNDNNLNCTSYNYPTLYGLRCAIIGAIIQTEGIKKAEELFNKVKNTNIYVQYPKNTKINGIKQKRYANVYYNPTYDKNKYDNMNTYTRSKTYYYLDKEGLEQSNYKTTMGFREYIKMDEIVFYIDNLIPNIDMYLKNIDWLGTAESMVYLDKIEDINNLENIMVEWDNEEHCSTYKQHDWSSKVKFENIYMYSSKYKHIHNDKLMCVKDIHLDESIKIDEEC
ncbi:hypothetical protein AB2T90_11325 [Clostridium butyricum]|uniref:hypothetical protein n=1 Tax=Clostridium butyricum TaxID=1492 RepID=UPI003467C2A3